MAIKLEPHQKYKSKKALRRFYRKVTQEVEPQNYEERPWVEISDERFKALKEYNQRTFRPIEYTITAA